MRVLDHKTWRRYVVAQAAITVALVVALAVTTWWMVGQRTADSRRGCERGKIDRAVMADVFEAAARGNRLVSEDPAQPPRTRLVRSREAAVEQAAAVSLRSRTGARLDCARVYPRRPF